MATKKKQTEDNKSMISGYQKQNHDSKMNVILLWKMSKQQ